MDSRIQCYCRCSRLCWCSGFDQGSKQDDTWRTWSWYCTKQGIVPCVSNYPQDTWNQLGLGRDPFWILLPGVSSPRRQVPRRWSSPPSHLFYTISLGSSSISELRDRSQARVYRWVRRSVWCNQVEHSSYSTKSPKSCLSQGAIVFIDRDNYSA